MLQICSDFGYTIPPERFGEARNYVATRYKDILSAWRGCKRNLALNSIYF